MYHEEVLGKTLRRPFLCCRTMNEVPGFGVAPAKPSVGVPAGGCERDRYRVRGFGRDLPGLGEVGGQQGAGFARLGAL
ncbi:hypothetical protein PV325_010474 [Microctonus aethiopoides]|nr:hypothetical protein PV325_010474 [Microctonus aethiopoides]